MFAGAFCDKVTGSGWSLADPPNEHEAGSQASLQVIVDVGRDVDDTKLAR